MTRAQIAAVALLALIGTAAGAQETTRVAVSPDSKLSIEGTSNLHGWSCKAEKFDAAVDLDAASASQLSAARPTSLKHVKVTVPVKSLKCGHDAMDNIMYKSLKADDSPNISYVLASFDAVPDDNATSFTLHAKGTLTIAGTEKPLVMDVTATRLSDGSIKANGTVPLKMTDYGIKPPKALLGTLRTGDEVNIKFELIVGAKAIATASSPK